MEKMLPTGKIQISMKKKQVGASEAEKYGFSASEGVKSKAMDMSQPSSMAFSAKAKSSGTPGMKKDMSKAG